MKNQLTEGKALVVVVVLLAARVASTRYSGGTGEPNAPYCIATPEDLSDIGNHVEDFNKCFVLVNDISLASYAGQQFRMIGDYNYTFKGVFDGNGFATANFFYMAPRLLGTVRLHRPFCLR